MGVDCVDRWVLMQRQMSVDSVDRCVVDRVDRWVVECVDRWMLTVLTGGCGQTACVWPRDSPICSLSWPACYRYA